jgi:hypothetical protein
MNITWPGGHKFAFTFCDDTDFATRANVQPVYDFLAGLGLRTTKLVWLFEGAIKDPQIGETCADPHYVEWLLELQQQGFEIALHNVAPSSSTRTVAQQGLERFTQLFGAPPRLHCNHTFCADNLYWGEARVTGWRRMLYNLYTRGQRREISQGHVPGSPSFWGDLARAQITYVRNFTFDELNTLDCCPLMPYHDPTKPYVNFWFAATNAASPKYFRQNFSIPKIDRLVAEGGLCLAYVHFGAEFVRGGRLDQHFKAVMEYVAALNGWFAPVSEILDFLRNGDDPQTRLLSPLQRQQIELRWMLSKFGKKAGV